MDDASGAANMQVEDEEEFEEATAAEATDSPAGNRDI
jgi:hypothetical protein